ncbi:MAG: hypothetical protein NC251_04225 [Lachnoclostridium sp.]|nr:hypothetical protein [Lachnospira sp.]MCM1247619.1 hypothetical protein [Lachnoclostridium sp.]
MATVNEQVATGRVHRVLIDKAAKLWQRISFWTKASDVEFDDGNSLQQKLGSINGITDNLATARSDISLSAKAGKMLQDQLDRLNGYSFVVLTQSQYDAAAHDSNTIYMIRED